MAEETFVWFAGVDWGSEKHQACIIDQQGTVAGERSFSHSGAGLAELGEWLLSIAGTANAVAVVIEVPHGPVVDSLIDRGFAVHSINPKQLDRLRDRFSVAGAKDDRRGATFWRMAYAPIGACFTGCTLLIPGSSSCVHGRASPKSSLRNGFG
jgi:hypothetical protein